MRARRILGGNAFSGAWYLRLIVAAAALVIAALIAVPVAATLPDSIVHVNGTSIIVADSTEYTGALGIQTGQIDIGALAAGSARQSDELDFGANRALLFVMNAELEFAAAPASGETVDLYLGFTPVSGSAYPGGLSCNDSSYSGTSGDSLNDSLLELTYMGSHKATADTTGTAQYSMIGTFLTPYRYACLAVDNNTSQALADADGLAVEITPIDTQVQE